MTVKDFLEKTFQPMTILPVRERAYCKDGFSVSIQGGSPFHYCVPRKHCNEYKELELGFPSNIDMTILKYAECKYNPLETIYSFVPIEVVEKMIEKHGGIINYPNLLT